MSTGPSSGLKYNATRLVPRFIMFPICAANESYILQKHVLHWASATSHVLYVSQFAPSLSNLDVEHTYLYFLFKNPGSLNDMHLFVILFQCYGYNTN